MTKEMDEKTKGQLLASQRNEITEHIIYKRLADSTKDANNKRVLESISADELKHHNIWKTYTKQEVKASKYTIWKYYWISRIFGLTFGVKLMENGEGKAQTNYDALSKHIPAAKKIMKDEQAHERKLINLINEEKLQYAGSVVLGLNDALVELTGALAGFTLALHNARIVAMAGLITGIAAALSMAASEYLSKKSDAGGKNPLKASVYTGIAYILTVLFLIMPFLVLNNLYVSLAWTILNALIVIFVFTFYISVAKDLSFSRRFGEMAAISLGVAAISYGIGYGVKALFGIGL
jgi:VIT1/CCC1 family predicted Fe2+/Mn2+ transporter